MRSQGQGDSEEREGAIRACLRMGIVPSDIWLCREWFAQLLSERVPERQNDPVVVLPVWTHEHGNQQTVVRPMGR